MKEEEKPADTAADLLKQDGEAQAVTAFQDLFSETSDPVLKKSLASLAVSYAKKQAAEKSEPKLSTTTKQKQLDFFDDRKRAAPNAFFRSALFPAMNPKQKQNREFIKNKKLGSASGVTAFFTGEQPDQSDLDIYFEFLNIQKLLPVGAPVKFSAYGMLKALGLSKGGENHKHLHAVIIRLCGGVLDITDHEKRYFGQLLHGGIREELTMNYEIYLNPKFADFFNKLWSSVDIDQRRALGRNATAKALHCYYSSHAAPTAHKFETLAEIIGLTDPAKAQLKRTIIKAHEALKAIGFLSDYEVKGDQIQAFINHSPSQIKYIVKQAAKPKKKPRS